MVNKFNSSLSRKPSFTQLHQQGFVKRARVVDLLSGEDSDHPLYTADSRLRPELPNEDNWISLVGLIEEDIGLINELLKIAQKDGVVFKRDDSGTVRAIDMRSIDGYFIEWEFMNVTGLVSKWGLTMADVPPWVGDGTPESGILRKIGEYEEPNDTAEDIVDQNQNKPIIIVGEGKPMENTTITDISFDSDTLFNASQTYVRLKENMRNRAVALMNMNRPPKL